MNSYRIIIIICTEVEGAIIICMIDSYSYNDFVFGC